MKRPKVDLNPVANGSAMWGESIIGVSSDAGGCLISLREINGRLRVEVYRADETVDVVTVKGWRQ